MNMALVSRFRQPSRWAAWMVVCLSISIQVACATDQEIVLHSFDFDARWDSPNIEILNYRYGTARHPGVRPADYQLKSGKVPQATGAGGYLKRGDDLYVKWRIKSTGDVYEDTVNLKSRLPDDITNHRIRFIVHGPQLYVYLITPKRVDGCPPDHSKEARGCIRKSTAKNGGAVMGCPLSREELRRMKSTHIPDEMIYAAFCYLRIIRLYPGKPEPLQFEFK